MDVTNPTGVSASMTTASASMPTAGTEKSSKHGPGYTNVEDLMVAKAFIVASEHPIVGAHQKGKVFKIRMHEIYTNLIKDQTAADKALLSRSSTATQEEYIKQGVGAVYCDRPIDSIYNRFKGQIAPEVMKYIGIEETTAMETGWSLEDHKIACLESFKQRYGHAFDFFPQYEYLKDKNKFSTFRTKLEEELIGKRPVGKKKSRQAEADAKLVKAVVAEVSIGDSSKSVSSGGSNTLTSNDSGTGNFLQNMSNVICNVGTALLENMRAEQDMRLAQSLDTPDRKAYAKEQVTLRIAETHEKRRKLDKDFVADSSDNSLSD
jgi:hypothetical protein